MSSEGGLNIEKLKSSVNSSMGPRDLGLVETGHHGISQHAESLKNQDFFIGRSKTKFDKHSSKKIVLFNSSDPQSDLYVDRESPHG
jgi:hypothetical protein